MPTNSIPVSAIEAPAQRALRKELGLSDLVLAQILCVVGSSWVGIAAKLGRAHAVFWITAMVLFYVPLAAVVIYLNRAIPLEGGVYEWSRSAFGNFFGFLTAWNLWVYAVVCTASILFSVPTDLAFLIGHRADWLPASPAATTAVSGSVLVVITLLAIRGLGAGKWLHNIGSIFMMSAYAILLTLPIFFLLRGRAVNYTPVPFELPQASWVNLAIFGQMTIGGLSGFEYMAIMAGECRRAARTIGQSVVISAPIIALIFILGTSSVLAFIGERQINLIGPIPQTFRLAFGETGRGGFVAPLAIFLILSRAVAAASLLFTGLSRLPMTAGWDHLLPSWFTALHGRWRTPVNSILFVAVLVMMLIAVSMLGVHEQEAMQLLLNASTAHYGITYVALFAIPLFGARRVRALLPNWLGLAAAAGFLSSAIAVLIAVYPIIAVSSRGSYAAKIGGLVLATNTLAVIFYSMQTRQREAIAA